MNPSRRWLLLCIGSSALALTGCAGPVPRSANADGTYCYRIGRSHRPSLTCTTGPIPGPQAETEARALKGTADRLTVYIVRQRWADTRHLIRLEVGTGATRKTGELVPESFARLRLPPGEHPIVLSWPGGALQSTVRGAAGDVVVLQLNGVSGFDRGDYALEPTRASAEAARVGRLRLVADLG